MCSGKDARIQVKRSLSFDSATALAVGIYIVLKGKRNPCVACSSEDWGILLLPGTIDFPPVACYS
jgi:hypothetical protein